MYFHPRVEGVADVVSSILAAAVVGLAALPPAATRPDHAASAQATTDRDDVRLTRVRVSTGVELQVAERGPRDGEPVLFLHGYTDSWRSYSRVLGGLPAHVRAIVPTHRGHGDSDRPPCCYRVADFAADAVALLDALGVARATIVGHSMGSFVAQRIAADHPGRVDRLVLIASATRAGTPPVVELNGAVQQLTDPGSLRVRPRLPGRLGVQAASARLPGRRRARQREAPGPRLAGRACRPGRAGRDHTARPGHGQHAHPLGRQGRAVSAGRAGWPRARHSRRPPRRLSRGRAFAALGGSRPRRRRSARVPGPAARALGDLRTAPRPLARARAPWDRRSCRPRASRAGRDADGPPARARRLAPSDHDGVAGGAAVLRPGAAPDLRVQPRRGRAIVRAGHRARCAVCDVLLGAGLRPRAEHQPADGRAGGAARPCGDGIGAASARRDDAARAGAHRGHGGALRQARGCRARGARRGLCVGHAPGRAAVSGRRRCAGPVRRCHAEPASVEPVDARRPAAAGHRGTRGGARARCSRASRTMPAAAISTSMRSRPPPAPSGRCPARSGCHG